ncbi:MULTISPECIES: helix-turn-helix domain-containing protein [Saccharopolyspora]|jgi:transcriptional regulator with XRE-family HTH domain|uniref:XRE family transcriptional regulator n=3 Tax=Saccharopolyspora TaxID=1835 RepID=A0A4R4VIF1_9PSEU|nr:MULTISPECIES: helix-turn-helix transcriptional regulator [Saccharopolyspora]MBQ0923773.1 helix-turn-helix transcriptional regulator [Saccharopolyspora endophytica]TDD05459.1 XRE family transcriptional regulator [Saccharopolyspora terrae]TDD85984.1 XRE family transcriptional regulator [Saccharopolyspora karakumensis]
MSETTPAPRAYVLGAEIRDARSRSGLGLRQLAGRLDVSHSVVVRWERGERVPSTESVSAVCAVLGLSSPARDRLLRLTREAQAEPPNSVSVGSVGEADQLTALLEFERIATAITDVSPILIPGLLQTTDYARAIMGTGIPEHEVSTRVAVRLGRREVITRHQEPVRYTAFLLESVLHQPIGGRAVLIDQLRHVRDMSARDNIDIRIIPLSAGWTPAHAGPFVLLEFAKASPVVHLEHHRSSAFLRDPGDVTAFVKAGKDLGQFAMSSDDSVRLVDEIIHREETTP